MTDDDDAARKARAEDLRKRIRDTVGGQKPGDRPSRTPREMTDQAAREAWEKSHPQSDKPRKD